MLHARLSDGTFILGIDANNVRKLKAGEPLVDDLSLLGGTDRFILLYGETLEDIKRELEQHGPLPPEKPYPGDTWATQLKKFKKDKT